MYTAWPAARTVSRSPRSISVRARAKSTEAPRSVASPAERSARPNPTDSARRRRPSTSGPHGARTTAGSIGARGVVLVPRFGRCSGGCAGLGQVAPGGVAADAPDVLLVLQDDPQRLVDDL